MEDTALFASSDTIQLSSAFNLEAKPGGDIPTVLICGNTTPMAPPSRTLCTNPFPHWYGTRTKGVIPDRSDAEHNLLTS